MVQKNSLDKVLIICGPTASSKSALAIECAKRLDTEVISADSLYIYKKLNIGTAKPTKEEMDGVVHHLIDVVEPNEVFSVGQYREFAQPIVENLINNGKIPIICGGTGFYINSLIFDLSYGKVSADLKTREKYFQLANQFGNEYIYSVLKEKDPDSAKTIHQNDIKRVIRALEICETGVKKSEIIDDFKPKYDYRAFTVGYSRDVLYDRINKRVDLMIENGLIDEVSSLMNSGLSLENQCMQGIGYKEVVSYLNNEISKEELRELIKLNTRHYAKRQQTFFKKMKGLITLQPDTIENMTEEILKTLWLMLN